MESNGARLMFCKKLRRVSIKKKKKDFDVLHIVEVFKFNFVNAHNAFKLFPQLSGFTLFLLKF